MDKKSFFNKYEVYNREGNKFSAELENLIAPLVSIYAKKGYSTIEIEHMIHNTTAYCCCVQRIDVSVNVILEKNRKAAKEAKP